MDPVRNGENVFLGMLNDLEDDVAQAERTGDKGDLGDRIEIAFETAQMNQAELYRDMQSISERLESMRRRLQDIDMGARPAQRLRPDVLVDVSDVRDTFYNIMVEIALKVPNLKDKGVPVLLSALTLVEAMDQSRNVMGITCLSGKQLTLESCPEFFRPLASVILKVKEQVVRLTPEPLACLKASLTVLQHPKDAPAYFAGRQDHDNLTLLAQNILFMAHEITEREEFQQIIAKVLSFCEGCKTNAAPRRVRPIDSVEVSAESQQGVTEELVRESFFQVMSQHALMTGLITKDALESQESFIYFALSHHALIQAMDESYDLKGAVGLIGGKNLTLANCPEKYKLLAECIFKLKPAVCSLTDDQLMMVKALSVDDPDVKLPEHVLAQQTDELNQLSGTINGVAMQISQFETFKQVIYKVVKFILE